MIIKVLKFNVSFDWNPKEEILDYIEIQIFEDVPKHHKKAVVKRMGIPETEAKEVEGHTYENIVIDDVLVNDYSDLWFFY